MSRLTLNNSGLGSALQELLMAEDIEPGSELSYQLCKTIYSWHPLGAKMVENPVAMAMSQQRDITIPKGPEERVREQFLLQWQADSCDKHIFNAMRTARIYGISSLALLSQGTPTNRSVDYKALGKAKIAFNVFDPLNTSGSLVLNQNPNAMDFQKTHSIAVSGQAYHPSRTVIMLNEDPLYIEYTTSAFGYVGRSVYQRALFPLKSFIQTMITDDMISLKAGVLVEKVKAPGSIIDQAMAVIGGLKRSILKIAQVGNVISIGTDDGIESLDLKNIAEPFGMARKNIIENIATATPMPAKLLLQESFAEGFGEGTEDAKDIARFVDRMRVQMQPLYTFMDRITQYRAWTPEFYEIMQKEFPELRRVGYTEAFYDWTNSFAAAWPSLLTEPDSEKIQVDDVKLKAVIALVEVLNPMLDPENRQIVIKWAADNFNELKLIFTSPLELDWDALKEYKPEDAQTGEDGDLKEPPEPKPFAANDSQRRDSALMSLDQAMDKLRTLRTNMKAVPPRKGQDAKSYIRQNGIRQ